MIIIDKHNRRRNVVEVGCPDCGRRRWIRKTQAENSDCRCAKCASLHKWANEAYRNKCIASHTGKIASEESRRKMSEAQKLRPPEAWQNSLALAREKHTKEKTLSSCRWLFNSYRRSAKTRGIEFNITLDEFVNVTRQDCHYCGEAPSNFIRDHMERLNGAYVFNGIDRVNNDIGYVKDNVVPCCKACNYAKRKMTVEEFLEWARKVYAHSIAIKSD